MYQQQEQPCFSASSSCISNYIEWGKIHLAPKACSVFTLDQPKFSTICREIESNYNNPALLYSLIQQGVTTIDYIFRYIAYDSVNLPSDLIHVNTLQKITRKYDFVPKPLRLGLPICKRRFSSTISIRQVVDYLVKLYDNRGDPNVSFNLTVDFFKDLSAWERKWMIMILSRNISILNRPVFSRDSALSINPFEMPMLQIQVAKDSGAFIKYVGLRDVPYVIVRSSSAVKRYRFIKFQQTGTIYIIDMMSRKYVSVDVRVYLEFYAITRHLNSFIIEGYYGVARLLVADALEINNSYFVNSFLIDRINILKSSLRFVFPSRFVLLEYIYVDTMFNKENYLSILRNTFYLYIQAAPLHYSEHAICYNLPRSLLYSVFGVLAMYSTKNHAFIDKIVIGIHRRRDDTWLQLAELDIEEDSTTTFVPDNSFYFSKKENLTANSLKIIWNVENENVINPPPRVGRWIANHYVSTFVKVSSLGLSFCAVNAAAYSCLNPAIESKIVITNKIEAMSFYRFCTSYEDLCNRIK